MIDIDTTWMNRTHVHTLSISRVLLFSFISSCTVPAYTARVIEIEIERTNTVYNNHARESFMALLWHVQHWRYSILFFYSLLNLLFFAYVTLRAHREKWVNHFKNIWKHNTYLLTYLLAHTSICTHARKKEAEMVRERERVQGGRWEREI